jgi:DNA-binding response OmpR family regulator
MTKNKPELIRTVVVDDDTAIVKLITRILDKKFGDILSVTGYTEVETVLGLAKANQVDLCITDLDMPRVNGLKCLKQLKKANSLTQVIILTAHPLENAIRSAFALGADDYLLKPIVVDQLCNVVQFLAARLHRYQEEIVFSQQNAENPVTC